MQSMNRDNQSLTVLNRSFLDVYGLLFRLIYSGSICRMFKRLMGTSLFMKADL
jgi:trehalose utilization protein